MLRFTAGLVEADVVVMVWYCGMEVAVVVVVYGCCGRVACVVVMLWLGGGCNCVSIVRDLRNCCSYSRQKHSCIEIDSVSRYIYTG